MEGVMIGKGSLMETIYIEDYSTIPNFARVLQRFYCIFKIFIYILT